MKTNVTLVTTALVLALSFGIAHAADTKVTGAAVGTPGAEAKGNSIPAPQQAPGGTADKGGKSNGNDARRGKQGKAQSRIKILTRPACREPSRPLDAPASVST
jgi:hypothetical protein